MGTDINKTQFSDQEFSDFKYNLRKETAALIHLFKDHAFEVPEKSIGFELEFWLTDGKQDPAPKNKEFIDLLKSDQVVPELSTYNAEFNSDPTDFSDRCFRRMELALANSWNKITEVAHRQSLNALMIGTLPTVCEDKLNFNSMSDKDRYRALNDQIMHLRGGKPVKLDITGKDRLVVTHNDVMLEAAATSLQIHLMVKGSQSARYYNAAQIASSASVALAANAPFLFGKELWDESRVPVFEQSLQLPGFFNVHHHLVRRVTFGSGYLRHSLEECFLENLDGFPILLPLLYEQNLDKLPHLRLHNGTIWRWNRPILGHNHLGEPHLRIEHRVPSSGPTVKDVISNMAFFLGLCEYLANLDEAPELKLSYDHARANFYAAAKDGLKAEVTWIDSNKYLLGDLIGSVLIPAAKNSLTSMGIDDEDLNTYFEGVLIPRVQSGQTGAVWQRRFAEKNNYDMHALTQAYFENQQSGKIVADWKV